MKKINVSFSFSLKSIDITNQDLLTRTEDTISKTLYESLYKINPYGSKGEILIDVETVKLAKSAISKVNVLFNAPVGTKQVDSRKTIVSKVIRSTQKALESTSMKGFEDEIELKLIKESVTVSKWTPTKDESNTMSKSKTNLLSIFVCLASCLTFLD